MISPRFVIVPPIVASFPLIVASSVVTLGLVVGRPRGGSGALLPEETELPDIYHKTFGKGSVTERFVGGVSGGVKVNSFTESHINLTGSLVLLSLNFSYCSLVITNFTLYTPFLENPIQWFGLAKQFVTSPVLKSILASAIFCIK